MCSPDVLSKKGAPMGASTQFQESSRKVRGKFLEVVPGAARFYARQTVCTCHGISLRNIVLLVTVCTEYIVSQRIFIISWFEFCLVLLDHPQV